MCKHHVGRDGLTTCELAEKLVGVVADHLASGPGLTLSPVLIDALRVKVAGFLEPALDIDTIAGRLRLARTAKDLSIAALARLSGVSAATIGKIEHRVGVRASQSHAAKIRSVATALGVPYAWLFSGDGPNPLIADGPVLRHQNVGTESLSAETGAGVGDTIGQRVHELRIALGLTQQHLASAAGIARIEVVAIESGRNKCGSARIHASLAQGFGISLDDVVALLDGSASTDHLVAASSRCGVHQAPTPAQAGA